MKGGNICMGLFRHLFFLIFHYTYMHLLILNWPDYMILVGCLFSHINHLRVGMYNLPLQLCFFPGNLSENNFIEKIITVSCSVTAVFPFLPQTWHYSSLFRLCTGQYSSSISSYWTLWTPWTVCFGVSRFISFDHISQVLPRFCSSNSNGILLTLLC